ncbi:HAD family hydrolase [[Limnothrix rosea] IAM M-220]|uniref:HAD family hydrolase n=1 Tax=[Limnothrix rosea] IAM M-220 TaxID=454133 RepID=UPI0009598E21|nr:HAD family phosphatase [[Limnothrix rosea] IAM M-220]OKH12952.1 HAD family hydrolase [[Limnothrix rosea] IAM M-220]
MPQLQAVLFEINGVFFNDAAIQFELLDEILLSENLRPTDSIFQNDSIGKSDRRCLKECLAMRGRIVSNEYLDELITKKSQAYQQKLSSLESFPVAPDVLPFITALKLKDLLLGIVTGYSRADTDFILGQLELQDAFDVIITADDTPSFKPSGDGYRLALEALQTQYPERQITAANCLAIEDNFHGIQAAKSVQIPVVGVARTYPFHMMQRCSNWCVDYLTELELERIDPSLAPPEEVLQ